MKNTDTKKLVLLLPWTEFLDVHLKKDTGLFPEYISKEYHMPYEIVFTDSCKSTKKVVLGSQGKIVKFQMGKNPSPIPPSIRTNIFKWLFFISYYIKYLYKNRHTNSHYMFFHANDNSLFLIFMAKLFNKNVKTWLKLDTDPLGVQNIVNMLLTKNTLKTAIRKMIYKILFSKIDLLSVETLHVYEQFKSFNDTLKLPIALIPNGINKTMHDTQVGVKRKIILSVARFGSHQKNTELLLNALKDVTLYDWKVYLIGPIETAECDFQKYIDKYYRTYPELQKSIFFTGNISDETELQNYYDTASVFILPSRFESFGLVSLEAALSGDFLILTDVGAARDLIINPDCGIILPNSEQGKQNDSELCISITQVLQSIIDGQVKTDQNLGERIEFYSKKFQMQSIVKDKPIREWITT